MKAVMREKKEKKARLGMQQWLQIAADLMELVMNYLALQCVLTAVISVYGVMLDQLVVPAQYLWVPLCLPFLFKAFRRYIPFFSLFLAAHVAVVVALLKFAGTSPNSVFWHLVYFFVGAGYSIHSIRVRLKGREEESLPLGFAVGVAAATFFVCSYTKTPAGCERIVTMALCYAPLWLVREYLRHYIIYVCTSGGAAGTLPVRSIFRSGMIATGGSSLGVVALMWIITRTEFLPWLTSGVKNLGYLLLKGLVWLLSLGLKGDAQIEEAESIPEADFSGMAQLMTGAAETPLWLQIVERVLNTVIAVAVVVGLCVLLFLFIRSLIRRFYADRGVKKEVLREGFVEEEERIGRKREEKKKRLPGIGGTPAERVRRIFWRTMLAEGKRQGKERPDEAQTARELAEGLGGKESEWQELLGLYERARYGAGRILSEDARLAGQLARKIRK